ncbi:DNAJC11 protein [Thecamonas trahens ATCC 50062]|uniref:DNAJC11 protein n=1 Tax=Thecamonas trahens ATCC 50062 TaxID=461836 RepID=A0A0L0DFP4_THETB|nr:DNAJC11 protein [Thecamonas trahens ATCC 50062]KNC51119.1 DNAJC11 protein [Thecamonas trahens ATCC 50062]|eukprot:XP_013756327.1 DNAJC11 protein [Thecamonas trahens ATCC 50062]
MSLDESFDHLGRGSRLEFDSDNDSDDGGLLGSTAGDIDFYTVLNVERTASADEIRRAYHRMSKYLHPDKQGASEAFLRVAKAYKVLSDERQRMIYDLFGEKGLETSWALAETLKTPEEMMREPSSSRDLAVERLLVTQSVTSHISSRDALEISGYAMARNGLGVGGVDVGLRRQLTAKTWGKVSMGNQASRLVLHSDFTEYAFGEAMASYSCRPNSPAGFDWALLLGRQMTEAFLATVCFRFGLRDSVEVAVTSNGSKAESQARVSVEVSPDDLSLSIKYGRKLSSSSTALAEASVAMRGGASVSLGAERAVSRRSKVSLELGLSATEGVTLELGVKRAGFAFSFPVLLYPSLDLWVAAGAAALPSAAVAALKALVINPNKERRKARRIARMRRERLELTLERAAAVAESMKTLAPVAAERRERESANGGLVIEQAWYGNIEGITPHTPSPHFPQFIPLFVRYLFHGVLHEVIIDDDEPLVLADRAHVVDDPTTTLWHPVVPPAGGPEYPAKE